MKTKIIGHRGAAGLALENTLAAIKAGIEAGADALEVDVRLTKDRQVVLCHDPDLGQLSGDTRLLSDLSLEEIKKVRLHNGESLATLSEALELAGDTPLLIELKDENMARRVLAVLDEFPSAKKLACIVSFRYNELAVVKKLQPDIPIYVCAHTNPFDSVYIASAINASGIDINFWILNPLTYFLARRSRLDIIVYTINSRFLARFIHFLYPRAAICTGKPHLFSSQRKIKDSNARNT